MTLEAAGGTVPSGCESGACHDRDVEKGNAVGAVDALNMEGRSMSIDFVLGGLEGRSSQSWGAWLRHGFLSLFDALPLNSDFGAFRPAKLFAHPVAVYDKRQIVACSYAANPVRKCRPFDTVSAEFSFLIDGDPHAGVWVVRLQIGLLCFCGLE